MSNAVLESNDSTYPCKEGLYGRAIEQFSHYIPNQHHYLDSAATSQKPDSVIQAITQGYREFCAPVHRASYPAGERASNAYENARETVARFINAPPAQLIFTQSCTASINQIALGWIEPKIKPNQVIWISVMEHNANYLPWRQLCQRTGARLNIIEMDEQGCLLLDQPEIWQDDTFLIALTHCSNVLGGENPIQTVCDKAKEHGIYTLIDAAQSVSHLSIDVNALGCDFLAFSAHKMYGPEGIGALYIKPELTKALAPMLLGGGMVTSVDECNLILRDAPYCFEAGSPNLSGALGFAAAVDFIQHLGLNAIKKHVGTLGQIFKHALVNQSGVTLLPTGGGQINTSVISFTVEGVHPHDIAHLAAEHNVSMRVGNHCSHLLLNNLGLAAVNRVSLGVYNNEQDIAPLISAINAARDMFG